MKKNIICNLLLLILIFSNSNSANADSLNIDADLQDKISRIGFNRIIYNSPQEEIADVFKKYEKYSSSKKLDRLEELFADSFITADGFDKKTYFDMVQKTWEMYPAVNYTATIKDCLVDGNYAIVQVKENAKGETKEPYETIKDKGTIESESYTFYYLTKISSNWKIISSTVITETTALKYGTAKGLALSMTAPPQVKAGEDYTATLNIEKPKQSIVLASLSNEPIVYPQKQPQDVFRNIKNRGILERVFKANKEGYNEFTVASVGITKAAVGNKDINISITGMAFLMTRVNILSVKPQKQQ